jgi:uncharacterized membrane protein
VSKSVGVSRWIDDSFKITLILKGLDGGLEVIGGFALLSVGADRLSHLIQLLTQHELSRDPQDFVARHLFHYGTHLTHGGTLFAAVYLLSHGLSKLVLVVALLQQRTWAYPAMIALLGAFIVYQLYRLAYRLTFGLSALTLFDAFVMWLTWREWQAHKRRTAGMTTESFCRQEREEQGEGS